MVYVETSERSPGCKVKWEKHTVDERVSHVGRKGVSIGAKTPTFSFVIAPSNIQNSKKGHGLVQFAESAIVRIFNFVTTSFFHFGSAITLIGGKAVHFGRLKLARKSQLIKRVVFRESIRTGCIHGNKFT
jgi:hypothetical protein